jgi:hypothetical protein
MAAAITASAAEVINFRIIFVRILSPLSLCFLHPVAAPKHPRDALFNRARRDSPSARADAVAERFVTALTRKERAPPPTRRGP